MIQFKYLTTPPGILKIAVLIVGLITLCFAFNTALSSFNAIIRSDKFKKNCNKFNKGEHVELENDTMGNHSSHEAHPTIVFCFNSYLINGLEGPILAFSLICLVISINNIILCVILTKDWITKPVLFGDIIYHAVSGTVHLISGGCMLLSAVIIGGFFDFMIDHSTVEFKTLFLDLWEIDISSNNKEKIRESFSKRSNFDDKITAGIFGQLNGVLYLTTCFFLTKKYFFMREQLPSRASARHNNIDDEMESEIHSQISKSRKSIIRKPLRTLRSDKFLEESRKDSTLLPLEQPKRKSDRSGQNPLEESELDEVETNYQVPEESAESSIHTHKSINKALVIRKKSKAKSKDKTKGPRLGF